MFFPKSIPCAIGITATAVNGYKPAFYNSASDVVVTSDRDGDHDHTVTFFSSDDCSDANVINVSQGGCITVDSSISAYSSFQHQLAQGVWSGVLFHEWDDNINVASNDLLEIPESTLAECDDDEILHTISLDERSLQGQCKVATMCTVSVVHARAAGVRQLGAALVDRAAAQAPKLGKSLWEFLNKPFIATVTGSGLSGAGVMVVNNKWSPSKEERSQCSTVGSEPDVIKGSIKKATYFTDLEAMELVLTLKDGRTSTISVAVTKSGNNLECGVPATGDKA